MIGREKQLIKKLNKQNSNYTMDYMLSLINEEEVLKQKSGIIWSFYKKQRKDSYGIIKKHFLQILDSIEDFQKRCHVSTTLVDKMRAMNLFGDLPESSQLSLF